MDMREWERSRFPIPGLTLADRDFARLVAITVCVMDAWELNVLDSRPIKWKRLPMTLVVRPEWRVLSERYSDCRGEYMSMKPYHDLVIIEARKIMRIPSGNDYA
jgi:hypothetical protein